MTRNNCLCTFTAIVFTMQLTFIVCIVAMFGSQFAETAQEDGGPECPRFDYKYKVIQRLVHIEDKCELFERQRGDMENKITEMAITLEGQKREIESLKSQHAWYLHNTSRSESNQTSVIAEIRQPQTITVRVGHPLIFSTVVNNVGNAYNTELGQFEAPVSGTYLFTVKVCTQFHSWINYAVMKDEKTLEECFAGNDEWYICGSCTTSTYLSRKEKNWVKILKVHSNGGKLGGTLHGTSSFTGVLLNTYLVTEPCK